MKFDHNNPTLSYFHGIFNAKLTFFLQPDTTVRHWNNNFYICLYFIISGFKYWTVLFIRTKQKCICKKTVSDNKQLVSIYENFEKYFKVLILVLVLKNKNEKTEISCSFWPILEFLKKNFLSCFYHNPKKCSILVWNFW